MSQVWGLISWGSGLALGAQDLSTSSEEASWQLPVWPLLPVHPGLFTGALAAP